jgi:hypothetical protein
VKAPVTGAAVGTEVGEGEKSVLGEGVTWIGWPATSNAACAAGMK